MVGGLRIFLLNQLILLLLFGFLLVGWVGKNRILKKNQNTKMRKEFLGKTFEKILLKMPHNICKEGLRSDTSCDGTSQVIRPTYSCPCLTDIRHPVDVPKSLDKFGIFPYLTRNDSPVLQTLQNIGDKELRKRLYNLHLF